MNRSFCRYFLIFTVGILFTGGCAAKQEILKNNEMVTPAATAKPAAASSAKPSPAETGVKEQPLNETTLKGQPAKESKAGLQSDAALEKIFFEFNSYILTPAARDALVKYAKTMEHKAGVKIKIAGYCDERGSDEYNLALGEKRAKAALQYLVTMGIPAERLSVVSYGKEKPADPGHDEAAWAKNRRDEFVIIF